MKKTMQSMIKKSKRVGLQAVNVIKWKLTEIGLAVLAAPMTVYATDAEGAWNDTMDTIQPWITRIGLIIMIFGGIEFAIAQSQEDAAQKTRAGRFMIAGAIVIAVSTQLFPMLTA